MSEQDNSSFIRWQNRTIEQLGFVNNLVIAIALGFLVLEAGYIVGENVSLQPIEACLLGISSFLVFESLIIGVILAINRLRSFRNTTKIARKRETNQREGIKDLRNWTDEIDAGTWNLLWLQTGFFAFGSVFLVAVIIIRLAQFIH